jgi:hypothetical protein
MFLIVSSIRKENTYDVNHQCGMQIQSCLNEGKGCMRSKASKFIGCNAKNSILKTLLYRSGLKNQMSEKREKQ